MLTSRERECLDYVAGRIEATGGVSPTYDEIRQALALGSKSGVSKLLEALIAKGKIQRLDGRRQALSIVDKQDRPKAKPVVTYPNAIYFRWDDEAEELKPWHP